MHLPLLDPLLPGTSISENDRCPPTSFQPYPLESDQMVLIIRKLDPMKSLSLSLSNYITITFNPNPTIVNYDDRECVIKNKSTMGFTSR